MVGVADSLGVRVGSLGVSDVVLAFLTPSFVARAREENFHGMIRKSVGKVTFTRDRPASGKLTWGWLVGGIFCGGGVPEVSLF